MNDVVTASAVCEHLRRLEDHLALDLTDVELTATSRLEDDLGFDSLNLMDFLVQLERIYHVKIADADLQDLVTIEDVVATVREADGGARAAAG
jgi:acyl carrier protein